MDIVIGQGVVPFLRSPPVDGVAFHLGNHVLCIIDPVLLDIAFSEPGTGLPVDGGLRLVESAHIGKGGGGILKGSLVELRTTHQKPCLPEERIVFAATEPLNVTFGLLPVLRPFGTPLDTVALDGFLTLLDSAVVVALADLATVFVSYGVEGDDLGKVILVPVLFLHGGIDIGLRTVEISVITGIEGMPPPRLCGILVVGTADEEEEKDER